MLEATSSETQTVMLGSGEVLNANNSNNARIALAPLPLVHYRSPADGPGG